MSYASQATAEAMRALERPRPLLSRRRHNIALESAEVVLAAEGGVFEFYALSGAAISADPLTAAHARRAIHRIGARLPPDAVFWSEHLGRHALWQHGWRHALTPDMVPTLDEATAATLVALSASSSGFLRERALVELGKSAHPTPLVVFAVLARLGDWVEPVRRAAERCARASLERLPLDRLLATTPALVALQGQQRARESVAVSAALRRLARPPAAGLLEALSSVGQGMRRSACAALLQHPESLSSAKTLDAVMAVTDPVVRGRLVVAASSRVTASAWALRVDRLLRDPTARVRLTALLWVVENLPHRVVEVCSVCCLDSAASVQDAARYYLDRQSPGAAAEVCRRALAGPMRARPTRAAVRGLATWSRREADVQLVARFGRDPRSSVAATALRGLSADTPGSHRELVLDSLASPSNKVVRAAVELAARQPGLRDEAVRRLSNGPTPAHRRASFELQLRTGDKWSRLALLLSAVASDDDVFEREGRVGPSGLGVQDRACRGVTDRTSLDHLRDDAIDLIVPCAGRGCDVSGVE